MNQKLEQQANEEPKIRVWIGHFWNIVFAMLVHVKFVKLS